MWNIGFLDLDGTTNLEGLSHGVKSLVLQDNEFPVLPTNVKVLHRVILLTQCETYHVEKGDVVVCLFQQDDLKKQRILYLIHFIDDFHAYYQYNTLKNANKTVSAHNHSTLMDDSIKTDTDALPVGHTIVFLSHFQKNLIIPSSDS